jgi:hypothetical protein
MGATRVHPCHTLVVHHGSGLALGKAGYVGASTRGLDSGLPKGDKLLGVWVVLEEN